MPRFMFIWEIKFSYSDHTFSTHRYWFSVGLVKINYEIKFASDEQPRFIVVYTELFKAIGFKHSQSINPED